MIDSAGKAYKQSHPALSLQFMQINKRTMPNHPSTPFFSHAADLQLTQLRDFQNQNRTRKPVFTFPRTGKNGFTETP